MRGKLTFNCPRRAAPAQLIKSFLHVFLGSILFFLAGALGHHNRRSDKDGCSAEGIRELGLVPSPSEDVGVLERLIGKRTSRSWNL